MENKKRLIYAEDLFEPVDFTVFQVGGRGGGKTMAMYEQLFRKRVELAPTVDAVEVVHGRWLFVTRGQQTSVYVCSRCNRAVTVSCDEDKVKGQLIKRYPYCHCGAQMDGGEEDA